MRPATLPILIVLAVALVGSGPDRLALYDVEDESRFWIDGRATTGAYTCTSERVTGSAELRREEVGGRASVPVTAFDCGISRMNRDFREALKADRHPAISFDLETATVQHGAATHEGWLPVRAVGTLTIAGTSQRIAIRAEGRQLSGGRVRVRGSHPLLMSEFGIDPPSGLLGLVRAHDRIVARFDITATPR